MFVLIRKQRKRFVLVGFIAFILLYVYGFTTIPSALLDKSPGFDCVDHKSKEVTIRNWTVNATLRKIVREYVQKEEILAGRPTTFLADHRSPCWTTGTRRGFLESLVSSGEYRVDCLPAFFIAGFVKCATTDLWFRLLKHPQIYGANMEMDIHSRDRFTRIKEQYFWDKKLFTRAMTFREYLNYFSEAPKDQLTGEATPFTIFSYFARGIHRSTLSKLGSKSQRAFQNAEILAPHIISEVSPKSKFIIIMREPGDRLLSEYLHVHGAPDLAVEDRPHHPSQPSRQDFHKRVLQQVKVFRECTERKSERTCAYDVNVRDSDHHSWIFLHGGYYATYIRDALKIVSWDKLLFLRYEDYRIEKKATLCKILKFLDINHDQKTIQNMYFDIWNVAGSKSHTEEFGMLPETRKVLTDFYRPMNKDLARLLNDFRFKFEDILDKK